MRRFNFDDQDGEEEPLFQPRHSDEEDEDEEELTANEFNQLMDEHQQYLQHRQFDLVDMELNQQLLGFVTRYLERSFFWRFYSPQTKLKHVIETYNIFRNLIDPELED